MRKEFGFNPAHPYVVEFTASVNANGKSLNPTVSWGPALGTGRGLERDDVRPVVAADLLSRQRRHPGEFSSIAEHQTVEGTVPFAGVDDHYFLSAVLPRANRSGSRISPSR